MKRKHKKKIDLEIEWISQMGTGLANSLGYVTHNNTLKTFVEALPNIALKKGAKNVFTILPLDFYNIRFTRRIEWLFTMFEGLSVIDSQIEALKRPDFVITPSTWVKEMFSQYRSKDEIFVCNHGVEIAFRYKRRKFPVGRPFRFLWVGAPNPRKGWEEVTASWRAFHNNKNLELYVKITNVNPKIQRNKNVILDTRKISQRELIKLYCSADCFVFPTRGEGFGLTLAEAMRTGLPCIATNFSGHLDFFDEEVGYPIGYKFKPQDVEDQKGNKIGKTVAAFPDVNELAHTMAYVVNNYDEATEKGIQAHRRIRDKFTWRKSAETLVNIIGGETWH